MILNIVDNKISELDIIRQSICRISRNSLSSNKKSKQAGSTLNNFSNWSLKTNKKLKFVRNSSLVEIVR